MGTEALRDFAQLQAKRQRQLAVDEVASQENVDTAETKLRVTAARIENLKARIEGAQSVLRGNEALRVALWLRSMPERDKRLTPRIRRQISCVSPTFQA
jgi:multidrug resistance efflux pump